MAVAAPTFFIFSDYSRPAIRLSALMDLPTIFVFTHESMGAREDGPTHQPIEQLGPFRAMPWMVTLRACFSGRAKDHPFDAAVERNDRELVEPAGVSGGTCRTQTLAW